ncbi:hypothetical protein G8C92_03120 [Paenibacillus donghaensis]|nr:hypothetical protein [Paenibacillus donghaensis]
MGNGVDLKMAGKSRKVICLLLALTFAFCNLPVLQAAESEQTSKVNLLAADMDTTFSEGISPFKLEVSTSGGTQRIVQIDGNNALEFRDASLGSNAASYFYYQLDSGRLKDRINEIYNMPQGSPPVDFVLEYKLMRSASSDKPVAKDIYAQIQFGNYDNNLVPRFPVGTQSISSTAAYTGSDQTKLKTVNDVDIPEYRFKIVPNGGQRMISSVKLAFSVRVDTGGTDEAYVIDDLAVYELNSDQPQDDEPPTAPADLKAVGILDTSVNLSWTASTDNVGVTGYTVYQDGAPVLKVSGTTTSAAVVGLTPNTNYRFTVKARDGAGNISAASNEVSVTTNPSASGLPEPFGDGDIGNIRLPGSASYDKNTGTFKVKGSGADIWGKEDAFHYVYRPWTGDGEIVARVSKMENTVVWTKPGIMIRGSTSAQAPYVMMAVTPANGVIYQNRLQPGGESTQSWGSSSAVPHWLKLVRKSNLITAYESSDGTHWALIKKDIVNLPDTVYVGLALTSHDINKLSTAEFDNVSVGPISPNTNNSPFPGTLETRRQWVWDKTKLMSEIDGQLNISQIVAQILDGQNEAVNLQKLDKMFQTYDWEQYKTVAKMYAYLMVGDRFSSVMTEHARDYFSKYAYGKLSQTENLRMSNYTAGYLVGQYLPDLRDLNGASGAALKNANRNNIEEMLDAGVHGGWAEYESPEYTIMTYLCLNALYQYSDEPDFKQKAKMAMDVMWYEWANDWINGTFISTSSRAKGDGVTVNDQTWRGADHTALSWIYFGGHRAQEGFGDSDSMAPAAYRPYLEYLGMLAYSGMNYSPPEMAIRIGQDVNKSYSSRKTNLQNSGGNHLKTYRSAYVQPTWGLSTEVTYNRVDNWIEDIPVVLRWLSNSPASVFRLSVDQADSPIGNYDQPENHRIMQDDKAAVGVFKSLSAPGTNVNFINAMFPDTGAIQKRDEQSGWVFSDTGKMYFAFKMIKPYAWYYQTPTDPANKIKQMQPHPTKQLHYNYNILRSQADKNGWVLQTADASDYPDFASFKNAVLTKTTLDASHINDANPRLIYKNLDGHAMDITFDLASGSYNNTHKINGNAIDYSAYKLFDTPWLQQEQNADLFTVSYGGETFTYNFANWTITKGREALTVPNGGFDTGSEGSEGPAGWMFKSLDGSPAGTWDDGTFRSPGHSVKISNTADANEGRWTLTDNNRIEVKPGSAYTFKAWAKTSEASTTDGAYAAIAFYKSDGSPAEGSPVFSNYLKGTNDWTRIEVTAVPPADAAWMGIGLGLKGSGTAWFDDAELITKTYTAVTGITLDPSTLSLGVGKTSTLKAVIEPSNATNRAVTWKSNNPSVADVDGSGKVTGAAPGTAVITATTAEGSFTAESTVTVVMEPTEPLFADNFSGGLDHWDLFGSTDWKIQGSGEEAVLTGSTTAGFPQRAVVKTSSLPYGSQDYSLKFSAQGDRFRTMFRYTSGTGYYFLEFKNTKEVELWKYPNASTPELVGTTVNIDDVIPGFALTDWHPYRVEVSGEKFRLFINDTLVAEFQDSSLAAGGIGFSVKSVGPAANVNLKQVLVEPMMVSPEPVKIPAVPFDPTEPNFQ